MPAPRVGGANVKVADFARARDVAGWEERDAAYDFRTVLGDPEAGGVFGIGWERRGVIGMMITELAKYSFAIVRLPVHHLRRRRG